MNIKNKIHGLIKEISTEVLQFICEQESKSNNGWVSAVQIKNELELKFFAVPKSNRQGKGKKDGWFVAIITRLLEDQNLIVCEKAANGTLHYRTKG